MKLAASNIAWKREDNAAVAEMLRKYGVTGIEVTPSTVFDCPWWREQGFEVVAMQGLLYGVEGASLWGDRQESTKKAIRHAIYLAAAFDIPCRVFGCPAARNPLDMRYERAFSEAAHIFADLAKLQDTTGGIILIEPLPNNTGCWFLNTTRQVYSFIETLPERIGVHLDSQSLRATGESVHETIPAVLGRARHCHASEHQLEPLGTTGDAFHFNLSAALRQSGYSGYVSLEQRDHGLESLEQSLALLQKAYA